MIEKPASTNLAYLLPICLVATLGGLLFGYDTGVISGAIEPLTAKFGLSDFMKGWASGCVIVGCAVGVLFVGPISDRFGRKVAMFLAALMFLASAMGVMGQTMHEPAAAANWMLAFMILYIGCFGLSVGPVVWVILSEIFPTAVRGRALGLATFFLWTADYIVTQTFPLMIAKDSWFVKTFNQAGPFYTYAFFCLVLIVVVWRLVPETKGRSLEEIERSWRA